MSKILIITISTIKFGIGHLIRSQNLANSLQSEQCEVTIVNIAEENEISQYSDVTQKLKLSTTKLNVIGIKKIIIDLPFDVNFQQIDKLSKEFDLYGIDDISDKRLYCKKIFYPYNGDPHNLSWGSKESVKICGGGEYAILNPYLDHLKVKSDQAAEGTLVSFGGSDPFNLSYYFLNSKIPEDQQYTLNLGPLNPNLSEKLVPNIKLVRSKTTTQFLNLLFSHQVIVCSFGVTAYEALTLRKPVLAICSSRDHILSAEKISKTSKHFYFIEKQSYVENPNVIFDIISRITGKKSKYFISNKINQATVREICE